MVPNCLALWADWRDLALPVGQIWSLGPIQLQGVVQAAPGLSTLGQGLGSNLGPDLDTWWGGSRVVAWIQMLGRVWVGQSIFLLKPGLKGQIKGAAQLDLDVQMATHPAVWVMVWARQDPALQGFCGSPLSNFDLWSSLQAACYGLQHNMQPAGLAMWAGFGPWDRGRAPLAYAMLA